MMTFLSLDLVVALSLDQREHRKRVVCCIRRDLNMQGSNQVRVGENIDRAKQSNSQPETAAMQAS